MRLEGLVGKGADHQANDGSSGDRCENGVTAIMIVDPVVSIWRLVEAPIIIVADNDRIIVIAIVPTNTIARDIIAIIDESECRT